MMNKQELVKLFVVASVALPSLLLSAFSALAQQVSDGFPASVPKAICAPGDHTESGVPEGTRLYAGQPGEFGVAPTDSSFGPDGLVIVFSNQPLRRPLSPAKALGTRS